MDNLRNRMRQLRTFGSVGAPGGQPPGATRSNQGVNGYPGKQRRGLDARNGIPLQPKL